MKPFEAKCDFCPQSDRVSAYPLASGRIVVTNSSNARGASVSVVLSKKDARRFAKALDRFLAKPKTARRSR